MVGKEGENIINLGATYIKKDHRKLKMTGMASEIPIEVAVRVRPLIEDEPLQNADPSLFCDVEESQIVIGKNKQFQFDYVFDPEAGQVKLYDSIVAPLIETFFHGYNATVFAYGQTGTGKTYTMGTGNYVYLNEIERGVIPRAITDIFNYKTEIQGDVMCKFSVSFIEIYCEETTDLLAHEPKSLQIRDDEAGNTVVIGVREEPVETCDDVLMLLDAGTAVRHVGSTNMNESSSRSHCIFTLALEQYSLSETDQSKPGSILASRFHFVDLAGSERAHRTLNQGERFKESVSINTGLLALGNVIGALSDPRRKSAHVPYRESKLTRLLKDSLGGNSRTVMITCLSPVLADLDENINSLKYASRAQKIKNKPVVNRNREHSKIMRMEKEIQALRSQLQRRNSGQTEDNEIITGDLQRLNQLQVENERRGINEQEYLKNLHEINAIVHNIEASVNLPPSLTEKIDSWRSSTRLQQQQQQQQTDRTISSPSRLSAIRIASSDDIGDNPVKQKAKQDVEWEISMEKKSQELDELRQEVIEFGEENAKLRLQLDIALNTTSDLQERVLEQQFEIQQMRCQSVLSKDKQLRSSALAGFYSQDRALAGFYSQDRVMQRFRVKNDLLMSQIDDMNHVEHDEELSSDDEITGMLQKSRPEPSIAVKLKSAIPVLSTKQQERRPSSMKPIKSRPFIQYTDQDGEALTRLESSRESSILGAKAAEISVQQVGTKLRELETNIHQKEQLIAELLQSEQLAKATSTIYREKLSKLEKDYEKAQKDLEDATAKVNAPENGGTEKAKLENEYQRKMKTVQKKYATLKQKETASKGFTSYQRNNEKRIKDLEANISRMKDQHNELERKLKSESEKKGKYEQEKHKNELRIKELELKTNQQQKVLKRKTEEVVAAQRKLRTTDNKVNEELEKKKQWIENEIEKVLSRQKDIALLESELRDRDISLKKKEALSKEKDFLEVKKTKSSMNISKDIVKLSVKMDTVDEQIEAHTNRGGDCTKLEQVKKEIAMQKDELDQLVERGGLETHEERRLIELGEALEAVDEAIQYKNDRITRKQITIAEKDVDHYRNVEVLLNNMGELSKVEYKHLLGKFFMRIIELRQQINNTDETRYHFEMKVSNQEKKIQDMGHVITVMESRYQKLTTQLQSEHEKKTQFLLAQISALGMAHQPPREIVHQPREIVHPPREIVHQPRENNTVNVNNVSSNNAGGLDKRVKSLEKELYYYKVKSRKYKDKLRDFSNNISIDTEDATEPSELHQRKTIIENLSSDGVYDGGGVHLPPVKHPGWVIEPKNSEKRLTLIQMEEAKRLQEIFDSKPSESQHQATRNIKKTESGFFKKRASGDLSYTDSIEVVSKNPWH